MKARRFVNEVMWSVLFALTAYAIVFSLFLSRTCSIEEAVLVVEITALYECLKWMGNECLHH